MSKEGSKELEIAVKEHGIRFLSNQCGKRIGKYNHIYTKVAGQTLSIPGLRTTSNANKGFLSHQSSSWKGHSLYVSLSLSLS